jgi:hypothetical protein
VSSRTWDGRRWRLGKTVVVVVGLEEGLGFFRCYVAVSGDFAERRCTNI